MNYKVFGISDIFLPVSIIVFLSTPLTPLLSFPKPGLNLDQTHQTILILVIIFEELSLFLKTF